MQSETTGIEPHTTDDESTTNNRCHSGAGAEADGGVRWFDLNSSNRDLLVEIYQMDHPSGQAIRHRMQAEHGEDVTTTRLYSNLNDLVDHGLLDKGEQDQRTNSYEVTNDGRRLVEDTARYFASIGATNPVDADGGREQTAVDVKVLEGRVETLSKGLAATRESDEELELRVDALSKGLTAVRESIDELKDDLEAERQERRLDPADGGQE
jgi:DNA-binding PadR family transcriptional regulator